MATQLNNQKYVEKAISFGIQKFEGLFKLELINPLDAEKKITAFLSVDPEDSRIGTSIDEIHVAKAGENLQIILYYLYNNVIKYPSYWNKEGQAVNKFGYDFAVDYSLSDGDTYNSVEMTDLAFDILDKEWGIKESLKSNYQEIEYELENYLEEGGAMIRFVLTLNKPKLISSFSMTTISSKPMELASLVYEEDTQVLRVPKSINILDVQTDTKKLKYGKDSISFQFPAVMAKRLTFVLRQRNYVKNTYPVNSKDLKNKNVWELISNEEALVTLSDPSKNKKATDSISKYAKISNLSKYTKVYEKYTSEMEVYKKALKAYNTSVKKQKTSIKLNEKYKKQYQEALESYNSKLKKEKETHYKKVQQYVSKQSAYTKAYSKYKEKLNAYNDKVWEIKKKYSTKTK